MGDVISSHLDEGKREMITGRTRVVLEEFGRVYEKQYGVALFNDVRFEIEGGGGTQTQLLHRKDPLRDKCIFSGSLYKYLEENKKWRHRFLYVDDTYNIALFENKQGHERGLHPKEIINCAGYRALDSMEEYLELLSTSLPGVKAKASSSPFLKYPSEYPLILWHPYARHHYFCVMTEKEHTKWHAVLQDCVRHANNGLSEESTVQTPAFTDALRLYRQSKGHYGTWDMMCGEPAQILANLVMETLHPDLRTVIGPRLKGKLQQRQRNWMLISDAVYKQVLSQTRAQHEAMVQVCESQRPRLDAALRTDMDQIITSKEHVTGKIRSLVWPRAEQLLRGSVQPYISSILEALMEPTSRGFAEVRDVFFRELVEVSKNTLNKGGKDKLAEHMEKLSMLAFHPVKMRSCYEKVEQLSLDGLQQRFDFSSPSVFIHRAQILMRQEMDNAVYTFEQLFHQALGSQEGDDLCKAIQGCQDRVLKKYDYDSSSVRKKFFREALLQIIIPYMLKQLAPSFANDLPRFQELIFADFSRFILVENVFEEVVLQSVTKDIMMAVKEAAVQRRHNLYRDSIIMTNSDPNLHLLGENPVDWSQEYGGEEDDQDGSSVMIRDAGQGGSGRKRRQVVSMIQLDGMPLPYESCMEVPGVEGIPEENEAMMEDVESESPDVPSSPTTTTTTAASGLMEATMPFCEPEPDSPDSIQEIRTLINPVVEMVGSVENTEEPEEPVLSNGVESLEEVEEEKEEEEEEEEESVATTTAEEDAKEAVVSGQEQEEEQEVQTPAASSQESEVAAASQVMQETQEDQDAELPAEIDAAAVAVDSDSNSSPRHDDSGFQSPTNEALEEEEEQREKEESLSVGEVVKASAIDPKEVVLEVGQQQVPEASPSEALQNGEHTTDVLL
ncbi:protein Niban 2a [Sardina pilchardus]|uniref:protein Niban 2a n=1 Tax=Sardina pilchardus TaxID=27697 RepID=UPI002E120126